MLSVEVAFLVIILISLPNLFYRAQFNVPLLLFAMSCWDKRKSISAYLLVLSWALEVYRLLTLLAQDDPHLQQQRKPILMVSTISAFVLKIILIIYLIVKEQEFRSALKPSFILINIAKSIQGQ